MARLIKTTIAETVIKFTFGDTAEALVFDTAKASEANNARARMHGWVQRIADAAALDKGATAEQKRAAMAELVNHYESGTDEWARERTGGGAKPFDVGLVVEALARVKFGGDVDKANRGIDTLAAKRTIGRVDAAKLFAADEAIATEIARIKAARAPAKVNADSLLDEIAEEEEGEAAEPEAAPAE